MLAAQFESFRDPFIILAGSVPLALSGALLFSFLGFTTLNIYSQVGLITLVGLVSKNGILIVQFANQLQEPGRDKLAAVIEAAAHAAAADPDDDRRDGRRSLSARARDRPGRRRAQQHRHHARERHDHRHRCSRCSSCRRSTCWSRGRTAWRCVRRSPCSGFPSWRRHRDEKNNLLAVVLALGLAAGRAAGQTAGADRHGPAAGSGTRH